MDKQLTPKQINEKIKELQSKILELNAMKEQLYDPSYLIGKYLYSDYWGYMYVMRVIVDENDNNIDIQGFTFKQAKIFNIEAFGQWKLIDFREKLDNEIEIISKEEFEKQMEACIKYVVDRAFEALHSAIDETENDKE
jgi:hypothetical protein